MSRLVVLCSKSRTDFARRVTAELADRCVGISDVSEPNMPREAFERFLADLKRTMPTASSWSAAARRSVSPRPPRRATKLPYIAIVTTYSGSEMAARWRIGVAANRITGEGPAALPATAIYDPELTLDLPPRISAASGMNAIAHAVESLYGPDTNPVVQTMAEEAIRLLGSGLPRIGKIRAILAREPMCFTAPGSPPISAPKSGSNTPSRSGCGNGSISTTRIRMRSRRPMRSGLTPLRRRRRWRASSARSAPAMRRAAFTTSMSGSACLRIQRSWHA